MEITQLKYFQVVAKHEHMTRAAEELFITQPTLSKTIALLEKDIGFQLFERNKNRIVLNDAGRIFLSHVDRAFAELDIGIHLGLEASARNHINLTISGNTPWLLDTIVAATIENIPDLHVSSCTLHTPQVILNLITGRDELAVLTAPPQDNKLKWTPLLTESLFAISGKQLGKSGSFCRLLSDFSACRFFASKPDEEWREITDDMCKQAGFVPNVVYTNLTQPDHMQLLRQTGSVVLAPAHLIMRNPDVYSAFHIYKLTDSFCQFRFGIAYQEKPDVGLRARFFDSVVELLTNMSQQVSTFEKKFID